MISITCTQCQTLLTIDDAFAGGVCRCQHCGTIQTVPSRPKTTASPQPFVGPSSTKSKSLYQNEARANSGNVAAASTSPSGLDDLANAVASSSGLSGSGLQRASLKPAAAVATRQAPPAQQPRTAAYTNPSAAEHEAKKSPLVPIAIGVGVLILALVGVIIYLIVSRGGSATTTTGGGPGGGSTGTTPAFCGEPLAASSVIYLLDDANSISNDFDPLKAATYASIGSLGPERRFAVILWNNGSDFAFPTDGLAPATTDQLNTLQAKFQDTQATGATHIRSALTQAMGRSPSAIVIVTAKGHFDDDDESAIASAKESSGGKVRFYAFTVGPASENNFLKMTVDSTGGKYRNLSSQDLRSATH